MVRIRSSQYSMKLQRIMSTSVLLGIHLQTPETASVETETLHEVQWLINGLPPSSFGIGSL